MTSPIVRASLIANTAAVDLLHGSVLAWQRPTRCAHLGANNRANTDYLALDRLFAGRIHPDDVLADVGCREGRFISWRLRHGRTNTIVGIEQHQKVAARAAARLKQYPNLSIVGRNVLETLSQNRTLSYPYNRFYADLMKTFAKRIVALGRRRHAVRRSPRQADYGALWLW